MSDGRKKRGMHLIQLDTYAEWEDPQNPTPEPEILPIDIKEESKEE